MTKHIPTGEADPLVPFDDLNVGVADHLSLNSDGKPVLSGGKCHSCGVQFFPMRSLCPKCTSNKVEKISLPTSGELYTYSTVHISASRTVPYHLGYVDLPGDVRLLTELKGDIEQLAIGDQVSLDATDDQWFFVKSGDLS